MKTVFLFIFSVSGLFSFNFDEPSINDELDEISESVRLLTESGLEIMEHGSSKEVSLMHKLSNGDKLTQVEEKFLLESKSFNNFFSLVEKHHKIMIRFSRLYDLDPDVLTNHMIEYNKLFVACDPAYARCQGEAYDRFNRTYCLSDTLGFDPTSLTTSCAQKRVARLTRDLAICDRYCESNGGGPGGPVDFPDDGN